jgi:2-iminobutanoate/2-iminopropanoate deaminase
VIIKDMRAITLLLIALVGCQSADSPLKVEHLNTPEYREMGVPFSEAVRVGDMLYLSGQVGNVPGQLVLVDGGMEAEARQTMENIKATLERYGSDMSEVVKCTVFLDDMSQWGAFNEVYRPYFPENPPARSAVGAAGLALGAAVEVECFAALR